MNQMLLQLFVGLGNPDKKLLVTRHNVGFWFLDSLSKKLNRDFVYSKKFDSDIFINEYNNQEFTMMKPMSYINNSGVPIKKFIKNKNIKPDNILVIYDDIDLAVGKIRLKNGGGSGGHKGLNSIVEQLGSKNFWRLRIGIGKPEDKNKTVEYVLGKPSKRDKEIIMDSINFSLDEINNFFEGESSKLMNKLNRGNEKNGI
jgi:PTH1 family peptidyl-tRNA hydrolase|tara:strand:- start:296 stop:895 length:600 start_codon:yes stop_codon:yes gene_type:complete